MRIAVISDVHGNLEALEAVLRDIDERIDVTQGDQIWCLGDLVGIGPNPVECVDLVRERCAWSLLGECDFACLYKPTGCDALLKQSLFWTRAQFEAEAERDPAGASRRWEFLGKLRVRTIAGQFLCVHGTPRRPITEYLFPEDTESSPGKMRDIFKRIKGSGADYCLVGHTHVPGVFTEDGDFYFAKEMTNQTWEFKVTQAASKPAGESESSEAPEGPRPERLIINPGSVGQPRDLDPRASYAIIDADEVKDAQGQAQIRPRTVQFFRLDYDINATRQKISAVAEEIAARNAASRDETGCVQKLAGVQPEPALPWLDRHIAELEAGVGREKKGSPLAVAMQDRVEACRGLRAEVAAQDGLSTKDLTRLILDRDPQCRAELERYSWLGNRLAEGR